MYFLSDMEVVFKRARLLHQDKKKRATTSFFKFDICVFVAWGDGTNTLDLLKLGGWNKMTKDSIWDRFEASLMSNFPMHPYVKSV